MSRSSRTALAAVASAAVLLGGASAADAAYEPLPPGEIVNRLNQFRAAHGLPANVVEDAEWSRRCTAHNSYMERNDYLGHPEDPSKPGYSADGHWAGMNAVLAWGPTWRDGHPWQNAPFHLNQTLGPRLARTGVSEQHDRNCLVTWEGYDQAAPASGAVHTFPGDGRSIAHEQDVFESPPEPQELVGLSREAVTGPFLMGFLDVADDMLLSSGSIEGPDGAVESRVVNTAHPDTFLDRNSGLLFAVKPLRPNTTYRATINFTPDTQKESAGTPVTHSFSFTTTNEKLCGNGTGGWGGCGADDGAGGPGPLTLTVAKSHSYRKLKKGLPVTFDVPVAGSRVEAFLLKGKTLVAKAYAKTITNAGSLTVRFKIAKSVAASLLRKGSAKLSVRVIVRPPGGVPLSAVKKTTLKK